VRYVSFRVGGRNSYGLQRDQSIVDLGVRIGDLLPDLRSYLTALAHGFQPPAFPDLLEDYAVGDVEHLPVCQSGKILCIGLNYVAHREETGRTEMPYPTIFGRFADTLTGHDTPLLRPQVSDKLDFEGELAVIIGRPAWRVPRGKADEVIAGYTCFNDGSVRDWQRHTTQFLPGKNFPRTAPLGPALVTPDEVGPLAPLGIETRLNGAVMQSAKLGDLIFPPDALIAYITSFTRLEPGDVIATGTPGGVGFTRQPPVFMKPGDVIEVTIDRVGHLRNVVEDEPATER
jgi:2-keto-4-pentenoate hydratase/2-oxohepta-3-ene-1,7-dioic acid hydratase in catechol pathway